MVARGLVRPTRARSRTRDTCQRRFLLEDLGHVVEVEDSREIEDDAHVEDVRDVDGLHTHRSCGPADQRSFAEWSFRTTREIVVRYIAREVTREGERVPRAFELAAIAVEGAELEPTRSELRLIEANLLPIMRQTRASVSVRSSPASPRPLPVCSPLRTGL